jgi:ribosomal protein S16
MSKIVIKFLRDGIFKFPIFYIVVMAKRNGKKSRNFFLEKLGYYNPLYFKTLSKELVLNYFRLGFWLNRGAVLSSSVKKKILMCIKSKFFIKVNSLKKVR